MDYDFKVGDYLTAKTTFAIHSTGVTWYFAQGQTYKVIGFHHLGYHPKPGIRIHYYNENYNYDVDINADHLLNFDTKKIQRKMKLKKLYSL